MRSYLALVKADLDLLLHGVNRTAANVPPASQRSASEHEIEEMRRVAENIQRVALYYRPGARCLPQAVAIARLLRRQGYPVTLVIAVRRFPFAAHAWVECQGQVLTDRQDVRLEFTPIVRNEPAQAQARATA
ncbi:MAG TPA: lasso peptide biosynthesis B2 protein [Trueperaceae bacterium]